MEKLLSGNFTTFDETLLQLVLHIAGCPDCLYLLIAEVKGVPEASEVETERLRSVLFSAALASQRDYLIPFIEEDEGEGLAEFDDGYLYRLITESIDRGEPQRRQWN